MFHNVKYHNTVVENTPTKSTIKKSTIECLTAHDIHDLKSSKANGFDHIRQVNFDKKYRADVATADVEMYVLWLTCGSLRIELVWTNVKYYAAANNKAFTIVEIQRIFREWIRQVMEENWSKHVKHTIDKLSGVPLLGNRPLDRRRSGTPRHRAKQ